MFYSAQTQGFYDSAIHETRVPDDAVEISDADYIALMAGQSNGLVIITDSRGYPVCVDRQRTTLDLLDEAASMRWRIEAGGIVFSECQISTDRESQSALFSTYSSLLSGLISDTQWKTANGSFILVTLNELKPIAQAVASHVRSCFAAEQAHIEAIYALDTQAKRDAYNINIGWPPSSV